MAIKFWPTTSKDYKYFSCAGIYDERYSYTASKVDGGWELVHQFAHVPVRKLCKTLKEAYATAQAHADNEDHSQFPTT